MAKINDLEVVFHSVRELPELNETLLGHIFYVDDGSCVQCVKDETGGFYWQPYYANLPEDVPSHINITSNQFDYDETGAPRIVTHSSSIKDHNAEISLDIYNVAYATTPYNIHVMLYAQMPDGIPPEAPKEGMVNPSTFAPEEGFKPEGVWFNQVQPDWGGTGTVIWRAENSCDESGRFEEDPTTHQHKDKWNMFSISGGKGDKGDPGEDGTDIQFIYAITSDPSIMPEYPPEEDESNTLFNNVEKEGSDIYKSTTWYDRAQAISSEDRCCWFMQRRKKAGETEWVVINPTPSMWSCWGKDGIDGDGVEYIYINSIEEPANPNPDPSKPISLEVMKVIQMDDFYPHNNWFVDKTDLPAGSEDVRKVYPPEIYDNWFEETAGLHWDDNWTAPTVSAHTIWCSSRKSGGETPDGEKYGEFTEPKKWRQLENYVTSVVKYYKASDKATPAPTKPASITELTRDWKTDPAAITNPAWDKSHPYLFACELSTWLYKRDDQSSEKEIGDVYFFNKLGESGEPGLEGPVVRGPLYWKPNTQYYAGDGPSEEIRYQDIVIRKTSNPSTGELITEYWRCAKSHKSAGSWEDDQSSGGTANWTKADGNFDFIATNLLLANEARIDFLTGQQIVITDSPESSNIYAGMRGGGSKDNPDINIWAGSTSKDDISDAPFRVNSKGELYATSAYIEGTIGAAKIEAGNSINAGNAGIKNGSNNNDIDIWAGDKNPDNADFKVYNDGSVVANKLTAKNATISGTITSGESIKAGNAGIKNGINNNDIDIWAGDSNPANAEFKVYNDGRLVATNATISGDITANELRAEKTEDGHIDSSAVINADTFELSRYNDNDPVNPSSISLIIMTGPGTEESKEDWGDFYNKTNVPVLVMNYEGEQYILVPGMWKKAGGTPSPEVICWWGSDVRAGAYRFLGSTLPTGQLVQMASYSQRNTISGAFYNGFQWTSGNAYEMLPLSQNPDILYTSNYLSSYKRSSFASDSVLYTIGGIDISSIDESIVLHNNSIQNQGKPSGNYKETENGSRKLSNNDASSINSYLYDGWFGGIIDRTAELSSFSINLNKNGDCMEIKSWPDSGSPFSKSDLQNVINLYSFSGNYGWMWENSLDSMDSMSMYVDFVEIPFCHLTKGHPDSNQTYGLHCVVLNETTDNPRGGEGRNQWVMWEFTNSDSKYSNSDWKNLLSKHDSPYSNYQLLMIRNKTGNDLPLMSTLPPTAESEEPTTPKASTKSSKKKEIA